jgi:hypothetical protein
VTGVLAHARSSNISPNSQCSGGRLEPGCLHDGGITRLVDCRFGTLAGGDDVRLGATVRATALHHLIGPYPMVDPSPRSEAVSRNDIPSAETRQPVAQPVLLRVRVWSADDLLDAVSARNPLLDDELRAD